VESGIPLNRNGIRLSLFTGTRHDMAALYYLQDIQEEGKKNPRHFEVRHH
jgi:hypothetical protein